MSCRFSSCLSSWSISHMCICACTVENIFCLRFEVVYSVQIFSIDSIVGSRISFEISENLNYVDQTVHIYTLNVQIPGKYTMQT